MRTLRTMYILTLACAALPLSGCMGGSTSSGSGSISLEQQVQQQDVQLRQLQPAQADAWNQIQTLRQEVNALKGQIDDLQNAGGAKALVGRVRTHDEALRQVERSMALNLNLGDPMTSGGGSAPFAQATPQAAPQVAPQAETQAAPAFSQPGYGQPSYGQAAAGGMAAGSVGYAAASAAGDQGAAAQHQPVINPSSSTCGQPSPQPEPQVQAPQKDISLALFDAGVNAYQSRKYDEAQRSFNDFLKNYKDHSQAPEAQYYLAECYFQRNQFADAALAYDAVIKKYPSSSSAPGAYLKQGISFSKLNQSAAAKARLEELIKKYPNSPEAARAKTFLKTNK
ncbi:MAG: tol-pal system protein YbgF [Desulfovibrio desulfuricans]|nr:tol-pal system protein YbgF [Desulfovibrio desulfuricans]